MADIHLQRIASMLERTFADSIDMTDYEGRGESEYKNAFLSRALAAYTVGLLTRASPEDVAAAVVDGFDDGGIDAVYFDTDAKRLIVCQSKWMSKGTGSPSQGEILKLLNGVDLLINLRLGGFNDRLRGQAATLRAALTDSNVSIALVLAYSGVDPLGTHSQDDLSKFLAKNNDPIEVFTLEVFDQARLYQATLERAAGASVELEIALHDWGHVEHPFAAYYGRVAVQDIARWWHDHGSSLLAKNIRDFKGSTDVNAQLQETLRSEPASFWYFNNGITLLCKSVAKKPIGGASRDLGHFDCAGVSVVNGAQTVGQIASLSTRADDLSEEAFVLVRLISLADCPDGFDQRITRATNTQNRIEGRDFASLDPNQVRLAQEFALDGRQYAYRSGDRSTSAENGCTLTEATVALACAQSDSGLAVQVKNQIGRIFDDLEGPPYKLLFNDTTSAEYVWRLVTAMRAIDQRLSVLATGNVPRAEMLAAHGNRFILHRVLNAWLESQIKNPNTAISSIASAASSATDSVFKAVSDYLEENEPKAYLQPFFKTRERCAKLAKGISRPKTHVVDVANADTTESLFDKSTS